MARLRLGGETRRACLHGLRVHRVARKSWNHRRHRQRRLLRAAQGEYQPVRQARRIVAFKIPWSGKDSHRDDPYWDFFINTAPADLTNTVTELIRKAPAGNIFPTKAELHSPEITSSHVKGMAQYFGTELIGIVKLGASDTGNTENL